MRDLHYRNLKKRFLRLLTAVLLALGTPAALTQGAQAKPAPQPEVTIGLGKIVGQYLGKNNDVAVFFGVPYAEPPVDELRFAPPEPLTVLPSDPFPATNNSIACQQATPSVAYTPTPVLTEDCLILNIWIPREPVPGRHPVMVWVHGGGTSGNSNPYNGIEAVEQSGIVLVTVTGCVPRAGSRGAQILRIRQSSVSTGVGV
jgi:para-nitrobenzyl esterase